MCFSAHAVGLQEWSGEAGLGLCRLGEIESSGLVDARNQQRVYPCPRVGVIVLPVVWFVHVCVCAAVCLFTRLSY